MVEPTRRAAPLAIFRPAKLPAPSEHGAGSILALPSGHVAGDIRPIGIDNRRRLALYELRIANETPTPLIGFAYPIGSPRRAGPVSWSTVRVPPLSSVAIPVEIALTRRSQLQRVVAELHGDGVHLTLDAEPLRDKTPRAFGKAGLAVAALLLCGLGSGAYSLERPRVAALAAPEQIVAGQSFQVAYALAPGADRARYSVTSADGHIVSQGALETQGSAFAVSLPTTKQSAGYDLRVTASNWFGEATRATHVVAIAPKPPVVARVLPRNVSLDADTVEGGSPIVVRYPKALGSGTVKLLDQDGTELASALLGKRGSSIILAPRVDVPADFRLVVDARRGAALAEIALPVRILPAQVHTVARAAAAAQPAAQAIPSQPIANAPEGSPIAVAATRFRSGQAIVMTVRHYAPGLEITLMDEQGEELQKVAVRPEDKQLQVEAPSVTDEARFLIVATFARGAGQDSVIQAISVRPR